MPDLHLAALRIKSGTRNQDNRLVSVKLTSVGNQLLFSHSLSQSAGTKGLHMRSQLIAILTAFVIAPVAAHAGENLGSTSSGSITIRVQVPPLAAALQAQAEGAVGINSVVDTRSAVMISLPSTVSELEIATAAVYSGSDMPVVFAADRKANVAISSPHSQRLNGMTRQSFTFSTATAGGALTPEGAGMTFVVTPV